MILSAEKLQHILVGKTDLDFETVFVKSKSVRTFHIRNDLRTSISVQLAVENMELQESYLKPQIINASCTAGFDLVLRSPQVQEFKGTVKYIINGVHEFLFSVKAKVEPVRLELSKNSIKLTFSEDNFDMFTTQTFRVINRGNAPANFEWQLGDQKLFIITPANASVQPGDSIVCTGNYSNKNYKF